MKLKFNSPSLKLRRARKFVYLVNDITNLLLKKERVQLEENAKKLRVALIAVSAALVLSVLLNIWLYLK